MSTNHYLGDIWLGAILLACVAFIPWLLLPEKRNVNFRSKFLLAGVGIAFAAGVLAQLIAVAGKHLC